MSDLCSGCGEELLVIPNPSQEMVTSSGGYDQFKRDVENLYGPFDISDIEVGLCNTCGSTSLLGPTVIVEGIIVDEQDD